MAGIVVCDCDTLATLRCTHLSQHIVKPGNLYQQDTVLCSKCGSGKCMSVRAAYRGKYG